jgi:NADH dehydrogenase [ubiquinone] 1 alpha subcomplex assembly factor 7
VAGGQGLYPPGRRGEHHRRVTPLLDELQRMIASEGPISVERYMALCLGHPAHGYYMTRDPFGADGDFTTAPEISQMFGELLGLWSVEVWRMMGAPQSLQLIELGPGRGTLISDLLRATRRVPGFLDAAQVHLVETSPILQARQRETLSACTHPIAWRASFSEVPSGPAIILANEFLDALPMRQFMRTERGWCERLVGLAEEKLTFGLAAEPEARLPPGGRFGDILEWPRAAMDVTRDIATRLVAHGGAALLIDYGYSGPAFGDTLQAIKRHGFTDPLAEPGEADLTVHVDFSRLAAAATDCGTLVHGPVSQGDFLRALGIETRAKTLQARAGAEQEAEIESALHRLTDDGPGAMGGLFKVFAIAHPGLAFLPGFQSPAVSSGEEAPP